HAALLARLRERACGGRGHALRLSRRPHQMSGIAVYSVVYPAALRFFADFWRGLAAEVRGDAHVYLSLHGVTPADLERAAGGTVAATFISAPDEATPAEVRFTALLEVCAAHDAVVLLD